MDGQSDYPAPAKALFGPNRPAGRNYDKTVEAVLAHHVSTHQALTAAAAELYTQAATRMSLHRDTGNAFVGTERRDLDWIVYLEDPATRDEDGKLSDANASALSIEFGHLTKGGNRVGGLYILTGAAQKLGRKPRKRWDR